MKKKVKERNESVDACTRNRKLKKKKHFIQPTVDSKEDEMEEIITSGRNYRHKISPSPSPEKYDIVPKNKERSFKIEPKRNKTNYYSVTNKKAKKYDYRCFEINNSTRQKSQIETGGKLQL